jgi:hypothetical protein
MATKNNIKKFIGSSIEALKSNLISTNKIVREENPDKNICIIYLNDKELNSISVYLMLGKISRISYGFND